MKTTMNTRYRPLHTGCAFCDTLRAATLATCPGAPSQPSRRLFTGALLAGAAGSVLAREGVDVGERSRFTSLVSAEQVEQAALQQYRQLLSEARAKNALAPDTHPQAIRLREIAKRIIPNSYEWNPRAQQWQWEVNLIGSKELNAFCMPGGKIAFFFGILRELKLNDEEVAMIMGHESAHALREHARERMGKTAATRIGAGLVSSIFGFGNVGNTLLDMGSQLLTLRFSREDETEADLIGIELAARSGYDPHAGVTLWEKMAKAARGAPPQFLSTHPSGPTRIHDIETSLPKVLPLFDRAAKPPKRFDVA